MDWTVEDNMANAGPRPGFNILWDKIHFKEASFLIYYLFKNNFWAQQDLRRHKQN